MPKPDFTNISSKDHLAIWDDYVKVTLGGIHAFHGAASAASAGQAANHAAAVADKMMALRQQRAQEHIDQIAEEKETERRKKATK